MHDVLIEIVYWFPWYVLLVLVPLAVRMAVERAIGIRAEVFYYPPSTGAISYELAFADLVRTGLYYPIFEELLFRGLPLFFFGVPGLIAASAVWVLLHPAWQLRYLSGFPLWKKIVFTLTTSGYYASSAILYSMMWLQGAGAIALVYHVGHNVVFTALDILREVELPPLLPRKSDFVKPRGAAPSMKFVVKKEEGGGREGIAPSRFVKRKLGSVE